ncbi:MAG TPA: phospholipase D-like domain-containing protein [Chthoniobacterales bacterium]|nr:phospholipase D-like domain-containing protein [Chthoniobacterales bacterium]
MHNKSFTADDQATIIGGRNVGDEYFGAAEGLLFVDLDVIAVGPIVTEVSTDFDRYWACDSSYPLDRIVQVLTNSLEAADGPWVYSAFAKRRKVLLEAGITLYEMRRLSPDGDDNKRAGPLGSSGSSLHAKTFSVDSSRFFVGSFNFDPRSRKLNTELGFVIDSPALAKRIEAAFHDSIPASSYKLRLSESGDLYLTERRGDELVRYDKEPGTSWWLRAAVWFLSLLPIEWLL